MASKQSAVIEELKQAIQLLEAKVAALQGEVLALRSGQPGPWTEPRPWPKKLPWEPDVWCESSPYGAINDILAG